MSCGARTRDNALKKGRMCRWTEPRVWCGVEIRSRKEAKRLDKQQRPKHQVTGQPYLFVCPCVWGPGQEILGR